MTVPPTNSFSVGTRTRTRRQECGHVQLKGTGRATHFQAPNRKSEDLFPLILALVTFCTIPILLLNEMNMDTSCCFKILHHRDQAPWKTGSRNSAETSPCSTSEYAPSGYGPPGCNNRNLDGSLLLRLNLFLLLLLLLLVVVLFWLLLFQLLLLFNLSFRRYRLFWWNILLGMGRKLFPHSSLLQST